jgi:hypothetical protein
MNIIINFLRKYFNKDTVYNTGALIDNRPQVEKDKDYKFEEIVASADPVTWIEKPQSNWRKFPIFNQNGSGSCVAQTLAKLLGVMYWLKNNVYVHFSATHIYQRRSNKPSGGMIGVNALDIACEGVTLEVLAPSQLMTDAEMDKTVIESYKQDVGKIFKIGNYVLLPVRDIETVASIIQKTGKAVMVWFFGMVDEWTEAPVIKYPNLSTGQANLVHSVTAVDFTLYGGKKAIIIDDSWGSSYGKAGQRVITEDWFKARNFFAAYPINFAFDVGIDPNKPKYTFNQDLIFSTVVSYNNACVQWQNVLKYEGIFPKNVESTGYFGAITKKGTEAFQAKYGLPVTGNLDQATRAKANKVYGA